MPPADAPIPTTGGFGGTFPPRFALSSRVARRQVRPEGLTVTFDLLSTHCSATFAGCAQTRGAAEARPNRREPVSRRLLEAIVAAAVGAPVGESVPAGNKLPARCENRPRSRDRVVGDCPVQSYPAGSHSGPGAGAGRQGLGPAHSRKPPTTRHSLGRNRISCSSRYLSMLLRRPAGTARSEPLTPNVSRQPYRREAFFVPRRRGRRGLGDADDPYAVHAEGSPPTTRMLTERRRA